MRQGTEEYNEYLEVLKGLARNARIVMIFSSAGWNFDYTRSLSDQSKEQIENVVTELSGAFVGK